MKKKNIIQERKKQEKGGKRRTISKKRELKTQKKQVGQESTKSVSVERGRVKSKERW